MLLRKKEDFTEADFCISRTNRVKICALQKFVSSMEMGAQLDMFVRENLFAVGNYYCS